MHKDCKQRSIAKFALAATSTVLNHNTQNALSFLVRLSASNNFAVAGPALNHGFRIQQTDNTIVDERPYSVPRVIVPPMDVSQSLLTLHAALCPSTREQDDSLCKPVQYYATRMN